MQQDLDKANDTIAELKKTVELQNEKLVELEENVYES